MPNTSLNLLPDAVFSVSEFLDFTNALLQPIKVTIQGEITSISHRERATYFSLTDPREQAKLECIIWKSRLYQLDFTLEEGQEVQIYGSPNIYKPFGKFSLIADRVSPVGEGALRQAFEKLKQRLEAKGFFAPERKQSLPEYPHTIGLVTSEFGDAIKDFRTHLGNFGFHIEFCDARVEGLQAVDSIVKALRWFNEQPNPVEVIVLTRGGGSLESLQAFNSEEVAKAIFSSKIPVVSAVGHENDVTIADLVADVRASTPTDAGKILSQHWRQLPTQLQSAEALLEGTMRRIIAGVRQELRTLDQEIDRSFLARLHQQRQRLVQLQLSLLNALQRFFDHVRLLATRFQTNWVLYDQVLHRYRDEVARHERELLRDFSVHVHRHREHLKNLATQLQLSDPEQKLKQGYSIVRDATGKIIRHKTQVKRGDSLQITLAQALIYSTVERVE